MGVLVRRFSAVASVEGEGETAAPRWRTSSECTSHALGLNSGYIEFAPSRVATLRVRRAFYSPLVGVGSLMVCG